MSDKIDIVPISGNSGLKRFISVAHKVFADDPNWIAPLNLERQDHLSSQKNPFFDHGEAVLFIACKNGQDVGRISAQVNRLYLEHHQDATGHFGFLDAIDDEAVFKALLDAAADWLHARDMHHIAGPFSYSINEETGVLIDGFNTPPVMMMGHARPYYATHIAACGFSKAKDVIAYDYDTATPLPRAMQAMVNKVKAGGGLELRKFSKSHLKRDLAIIIDIFNDAWSQNWGFVPMTEAEIAALGQVLRFLIREDFITIASYQGRPAAMAVTLPDLNDWIAHFNGQLGPLKVLKLLRDIYTRPPARVRMPLMGVRREYHGTIIGSALALAVIDKLRSYHAQRGTKMAELSWILEDNTPMRRIIEQLGGIPYKTYRVYHREL